MREGKPAYVTAVSRSDTIDGWRYPLPSTPESMDGNLPPQYALERLHT
jgi:hypothetical protein